MAIPPFYPSLNQQWTNNGIIYTWNGNQWIETENTNYSFNQIQIDGGDKFNSFSQRNINFRGINLVIYSGGVNTLVFSAQPQTNSSSTFSGGTVSGPTNFTNGLTANTIYATTYQNLPSSTFSGGTVTGPTNFTNGLTANTISATTYYNLPIINSISGASYSAGTLTFTNNTGGTVDVTGFFTGNTMTGQTTVDFGFTGGGESDYATTVVSNTNILQSSMVMYSVIASNDHQQTEDSLLDGLTFKTSDIIEGVSFTVNCYSLNNTWGSYNVFYKIIN